MKAVARELFSMCRYDFYNLLRAKWILFYGLFFGAFSFAILQFGGDDRKAVASLMSLTLLIVPMVSILFSTIYWYNAESFTSLLLTQPVRRSTVYLSKWIAVSASLGGSFFAGSLVGLVAQSGLSRGGALLLALGTALTFTFVGLGMWIAVAVTDRMKGIGVALAVFLYCAVLHDALVFFILASFQDYPIEVPGMLLMALNPVDLARAVLLMSLEFAAMMGYTGRILQKVLSGGAGIAFAALLLLAWISLPVVLGARKFGRSDL